jgi:hypothetical protein
VSLEADRAEQLVGNNPDSKLKGGKSFRDFGNSFPFGFRGTATKFQA